MLEDGLRTPDGEPDLAPGGVARIPKGTPHAFANGAETAGQRLVILVSAGPERLWEEVGVPATDRGGPPPASPDPRAFGEPARRHGLKVVRSRD